MNFWLVYDEARYRRNTHYADLYQMHFKKRGVLCQLIFVEKLTLSAGEWRYKGEKIKLPSGAIMRTFSQGLSIKLEQYGVRVFNSSKVAEVGNNKFLTYNLACNNSIPTMETHLVCDSGDMPLPYPFIMKSLDGYGGSEVFLIENQNDYAQRLQAFNNKQYIVQKVASDIGKDLRVYVLGNKIIAGMLRTSDSSFKSNYSLGGKAKSVKVSDDICEIVKNITKSLSCDFVGIDFVFDNNIAKLNEIEDIVGSRMLYGIGLDIVSSYVDYMINQINILKNSNLAQPNNKGELWEDLQKTVQ